MKLAWVLAACAGLLNLAACERHPSRVSGQAPVHTATIDIQPHAFDADSDLRRRIDVVSFAYDLRAVVETEMPTPIGNDVAIRIDEPDCLSFETVLIGSHLDPSRITVTLHTFAHECSNAPDPEAFWLALLETTRDAKGVAGVRDGVFEFTPAKPKSVEEQNREALANAKPGEPVEVHVAPDRLQ